ncbi:MAG: hypothetical protein ACI83N_001542 [Hydrogenophaga sp.]|jgi:hypothetical protein
MPRSRPEPGACVTLVAMKHFLTCLALTCVALHASAQTLWRDAPMNASPAEIRALMPEVQDTSSTQRALDRSALLQIPSAEIAGEDFVVTYHFESNRLQRIHLQAKPPTPERMQALLQALQLPLRTRYGLPISTKSRQDMVPGSVDLKWGFRRMTVLLQMVDGRTVDLTYSTNLPVRPGGL